MIAAGGRQRPDSSRPTSHRVDTEDLVELADSVTAAEFVGERAESDCRAVVEDGRQSTDRPRAATDDHPDICGRGVGGVEPAEQENPASERRDGRVLNRGRERAGRARTDAQRTARQRLPPSRRFPVGRSSRSRAVVVIRGGRPDPGCACGGGEQQSRDRDPTPPLKARPPLGTRERRVRHGRLGCPTG